MTRRFGRIGGLLALAAGVVLAVGCTNKPGETTAPGGTGQTTKGTGKEEHAEEGPHHGPLVEWGEEEYHVEFTVDKGEAKVYVLGKDAKTAAPVKADKIQLSNKSPSFQVDLKASPQTGDPKG